MVASDDDMAPSLQLWDLRNSVSPVRCVGWLDGAGKGCAGQAIQRPRRAGAACSWAMAWWLHAV